MKKIIWLWLLLLGVGTARAQFTYGTTGLLNMPTADMQRDKTFMAGANWLDTHGTVPRWWYDTFNYYINITIFPWLEVGYLCTGHKAVPTDYGNAKGYWVPRTYGKFTNQDRSFHARLRLWKEGWWKEWTPQIVVGGNDAIGDSAEGGSLTNQSNQGYSNGFWTRYFLAVTKHFDIRNVGTLGVHAAWIYSSRFDNDLSDPAVGVNFQPGLPEEGNRLNRFINGLNLMAEVTPGYTEVVDRETNLRFDPNGPKYQVNVGANYAVWKDYVNVMFALYRCQYPSVGVRFKVHLK